MQITDELVEHLETLAKLRLKDNEIERIKKDMTDILEYMKLLDEVDVSGYQAMTGPVESPLELREDRATKFDASKILKEAPKLENNLIPVSSIHAK